ncbi:MAG: alanine:cation symporter family protein, partial [Crocinitomicaceae bacterium]|nr:alanine:cation symporter family protein [Crocinitomicaceae bacterium]
MISIPLLAGLTLTFRTFNPTAKIKDGEAEVLVSGGTAPFTYKWSKQDIPLSSPICSGMDEGQTYRLTVTDSAGRQAEAEVAVEASSAQEKINHLFIPAVAGINSVILWDPFSSFGLFDPRVRDEQGGLLLHPNGDTVEQPIFLVVVWLMFGALFFTLFMRFVNMLAFGHAIALTRGYFNNPADKGELTHFQALATALSGTVGLGNIAGVATALAIGGPGATFWMIVAGLLGMSSKFVECTLSVKYRKISESGEVSGGPMYYLTEGLAKRKLAGLGKVLAVLFALMCVGGSLGGGNMFQSNQSFAQFSTTLLSTGVDVEHTGFIFGIVMAALAGLVIIGGI